MNKGFCVYEHVFPNGKKYIGISSNAEKRWRNGKGYETQGKIAKAIQSYGWENIQHNVIADNLSAEQAGDIEKYLIAELDTINNGYNTSIGGENINTTFLREHILYEIRESDALDIIYGANKSEDGIVSVFERAKYDKEKAELLNKIDEEIQRNFPDYKELKTNYFYDGRLERCEAYWYYARTIYEQLAQGYYDTARIVKYEKYRESFYQIRKRSNHANRKHATVGSKAVRTQPKEE